MESVHVLVVQVYRYWYWYWYISKKVILVAKPEIFWWQNILVAKLDIQDLT